MRWSKPKPGDTRIRKSFLLFPKCINKECRWLEYTKWKEKYTKYNIWDSQKWIDNDG